MSSDSLVVLVNVCNILCHHLVLRDFLQSFSFAVAFKFSRSLDACISFHLYSLTLHFCCGDTRVRAPLSEPTSSATSRDCVTTTTCPYSKAARARLINIFPILTELIVKDVVKNQLQANSRVGQDWKKVFCNSWHEIFIGIYVKEILESCPNFPVTKTVMHFGLCLAHVSMAKTTATDLPVPGSA